MPGWWRCEACEIDYCDDPNDIRCTHDSYSERPEGYDWSYTYVESLLQTLPARQEDLPGDFTGDVWPADMPWKCAVSALWCRTCRQCFLMGFQQMQTIMHATNMVLSQGTQVSPVIKAFALTCV